MDREEAIDKLLKPIELRSTTSISSQKKYVFSRHQLVYAVYPFMTAEEQKLVHVWLKNSEFSWEEADV